MRTTFQRTMAYLGLGEDPDDVLAGTSADDLDVVPAFRRQQVTVSPMRFVPRDINDIEGAAQLLRAGRTVLVDLTEASNPQRIVDFLAGMVFSAEGRLEPTGPRQVLVHPS